ncbi:MAG: MFS transporter, partial [Chloroflexi bacterium]|nr:MFS transporter [Chloroflexota bacterium]
PLVLGGLAFFGLASLGAAVAPSLWVVLVFRVLQAAAGALIIPNGFALARQIVPEARRGRGFGLIGAAVGIAAASGPPLGGVLVETAGWRAIFYVNLLLVAPALFLGWRWLPAGYRSDARRPFDIAGAIMLPAVLAGSAGLLMTIGRDVGVLTQVGAGLAIVAVALVLVWRELGHPDPVFQLRLFRNRAFAAAGGGVGLSNLAMYTLLLSVPILLAQRGGSSSLEIGVVLTALSASMIVMAPFGGFLVDRFGRRVPTVLGLGLLTLGTAPIAMAGAAVTLPTLVVSLAVVGIGLGVATPGLQTSAVESVAESEAGVASGLYSTNRYLGSILGTAILAGLLGGDRSDLSGLDTLFVIVLVAALLATLAALGLRARPGVASAG